MVAGIYKFSVLVSDGRRRGTAEWDLVVSEPPRKVKPPAAKINPAKVELHLPDTNLILDALNSDDDADMENLMKYSWSIKSGSIGWVCQILF
jgi:hypothetical protein